MITQEDIVMDIKNEITKLVKKITGDKSLLENFKKDPLATVKKLLGESVVKDLSSDTLGKIVEGVKAKVNIDDAKGILSKVKGLFNK